MSRFQNPSRYAPASQIALTTTEADIALEQFQNDSSFLFEQLDSHSSTVTTESFSKLKDVVMTTISAILKKIGELIKRFLNWIKGNKKDVKKEVEETKKSTQTAYEKADACFRNPETREEAIKILMEKNSKFFGRDFLNNFIHDKNGDAIYEAVVNSSPIFKTNYFTLEANDREDMLEATRKLLYNPNIKELDKAVRYMAELSNKTDKPDDSEMAAGDKAGDLMDECLELLHAYANAFCDKDIDLPDAEPSAVVAVLSDAIKERLTWMKTQHSEQEVRNAKKRNLLKDVEDLEFNLYRLEQASDKISDLEDSLYKLNSDLMKNANKKKEEGNSAVNYIIVELVKFYSGIISTILHVNNTFYAMTVQVTKAVHSATDAVGKLLDEVAKEVKQSDKPTTESISTKPPTFKHQLALGIEGISFQDGSFFNALVEKVQDLRDSKNYSPKNIEKNGINQMVFEKTGMLISFGIDPSRSANAFVLLPHLDKNHPFFPMQWREFLPTEAINMIKAGGGELRGSVDLINAKVSGIYSKVEVVTKVTKGMFENTKYTTEEICAIICHELGHLFTYFEMFGRINRTANIVSAMCRAMYEMEDQQQRETIIKEAAKSLQISIEDPSELARIQRGKREDTCVTVFVTKAVHASRSETGYHAYEMRSCEQLADDFAMRMGAGRHLATGLHKLYDSFWESSTISTTKHVIMQLFDMFTVLVAGQAVGWALGGVAAMSAGAVIFPLLILMLANPNEKVYDNGEDRIMLMKRTLVTALKNKDLPEELRKSYLSEITAIDEIVKKLDFKRGIFEYIITTFGVRGRREYRQEQIMKDVENLLTNDLFVHAQQLRAGV